MLLIFNYSEWCARLERTVTISYCPRPLMHLIKAFHQATGASRNNLLSYNDWISKTFGYSINALNKYYAKISILTLQSCSTTTSLMAGMLNYTSHMHLIEA